MDREKNLKKLLLVVLTDDEVRESAARSSRLLGDLEEAKLEEKDAERERKRAVDQLYETQKLQDARAKCERIETEARRCARVSREGKEERLVECEWQEHGSREILVRLDTGEQIDSRPLTAERRQQELPLEGDPVDAPPPTLDEPAADPTPSDEAVH